MKVNAIMSGNPACCTRETKLTEVARLMEQNDCGEIPVVDSEASMRPVGVVTDRDIVLKSIAKGRNPLEMKAGDCMTSPAVTVKPEASLDDVKKVMEDHQIRRVVVTDETGRCVGIVSQADIALRGSKGDTGEVVKEVSKKQGAKPPSPSL
ncbi:MAG TPA: CBS domain-containing protein [Vicinamibacteria bacterium]|jgi:CBS domain-containing protein|nr:CBS domain-containing protein [Vicinamibacteria bacterium]